MRKLIKIALILILVFIPPALGVFGIKKFFPKDFDVIENKAKFALIQKLPFLSKFIAVKNEPEGKKARYC